MRLGSLFFSTKTEVLKFNVSHFVPLQICSLLRGGIAERGGVRVGHRIIEINGQSVVAVPHDRIVNLLATSVGEVSVCAAPDPGISLIMSLRSLMVSKINNELRFSQPCG